MNIDELVQEKLRLVFHDKNILFDKSRFAGGLTNYNYIMKINGTEFVIRRPGNMTEQMIDRKIDKINNNIASEFGINADCIYFDDVSGIKISVYIKNSRNMAQDDPYAPQNLKKVAGMLKRVHTLPRHFVNRFDWQRELCKYEQLINQLHGDFFFDYDRLKTELTVFLGKSIVPAPLVPCHNDTVPENFIIDNAGKTYLIDWEYSGMNDPCWDVAAYILESKLSTEAINCLTWHYFGRALTLAEELRIKGAMMEQDLLWTAWALVRHYNGDDFLDYCRIRYERFRKNITAINQSAECPIASMVTP